MADRFGSLVARLVNSLVRWVVLPVTSVIPRLVSSGLLFLAFAVLWVGFGVALIASPSTLEEVSSWLGGLMLPVQALAWLLFLPVTAGLWVLGTDWPFVLQLVVIAGLAGWNLLVLRPGRPAPSKQAAVEQASTEQAATKQAAAMGGM